MQLDTLAIVLATALGPVFAVLVSFWREDRRTRWERRIGLFRSLMATRRIGLSADHVNALNLIEVDFYGCDKIQQTWKAYKDHLFAGGLEDAVWDEKKERLLANMLYEIALQLNLKIPVLDIFKGGYAPKGWQHRDSRQTEALEYIYGLAQGNKTVPISLHGVTPPKPHQPSGPSVPV